MPSKHLGDYYIRFLQTYCFLVPDTLASCYYFSFWRIEDINIYSYFTSEKVLRSIFLLLLSNKGPRSVFLGGNLSTFRFYSSYIMMKKINHLIFSLDCPKEVGEECYWRVGPQSCHEQLLVVLYPYVNIVKKSALQKMSDTCWRAALERDAPLRLTYTILKFSP